MREQAQASRTTQSGGRAIHWLDDGRQRLGLVPGMGGGVAAWLLAADAHPAQSSHAEPFHLWRPWSGNADPFSLASLPLVPWSNRISGGGFEAGGQFHPLQPNRLGEAFPIHGEGWLQAWDVTMHESQRLEMRLHSEGFQGSPYHYLTTQSYHLLPDGIAQELTVTHLGRTPLPYGLGQHPWLLRSANTRLQAEVTGVWYSHANCLPKTHNSALGEWDLRAGVQATGSLIDNAFTGWTGRAAVEWPDAGWSLSVSNDDPEQDTCLIVYRPDAGPTFCFEPVTHPVDAIHLPGQPGLRWLGSGDSMRLALQWRFGRLGPNAPRKD